MIQIEHVRFGMEREPLKNHFGFKGDSISELWQSVVVLEGSGHMGMGLGVQSVLWSDPAIFQAYGEQKGNALMSDITQYALRLIKGVRFSHPVQLLEDIQKPVLKFARQVTDNPHLKETFVWNALVPVDNAAWMLYARENGLQSFDEVLPGERQKKLLNIPLIAYGTSEAAIGSLLQNGCGLLKIKLGADPEQRGDPKDILRWDKQRLWQIHTMAAARSTPYTVDGTIHYYLDANGRYQNLNMLQSFLEYADHIGALEKVALFEEPFAENALIDVSSLPVTVAADESAHDLKHVQTRIELGYRALALKPIAKTLSLTLAMLKTARAQSVETFCADLTVNPVLVGWNENVAARLTPLRCMRIGAFESNGAQNYQNWNTMVKYCQEGGTFFQSPVHGVYELDKAFYRTNGGIFEICPHYLRVASQAV